MNYRLATILSHESIATAGTKTIDITLRDIITRISIQVKATNNGAAPTAHPANILSKIELVDGSDVLFGLSGKEMLASQFFDTMRTPFVVNNYLNDVMNITVYEYYFGRYLYDPMLALDPTRFTNPQLKITHNLANGGSSPDACTLEVTADIFDEREATPQGFLTTKENVSYTLVASANEYIDLPTDYVMRKLILMSRADDKQPWEQYNEVKLSEDNDRRIPIDDKTSDLLKYQNALFPKINESIEGAALTTTRDFYTMSTYEQEIAGLAMGFASAYLTTDYMYGGNVDLRASAACNFKAIVTGYAPFGALCLPFGDPSNMEDWYNVTNIGNLRLTVKAGSSPGSNSTAEVITQQMRPYAA